MPLAAMLAAFPSIDASLCGVLRAFFGCFLSLLRGMKTSLPFSTTGAVFAFVVMVFLLWGQGCSAALRCSPGRRRDRGGCKAQGQTGGGGSPGLHERIEVMTKVRSTHP